MKAHAQTSNERPAEQPAAPAATSVEAFGDGTRVIELPYFRTADGEPARIRIRHRPWEDLAPALEGLPSEPGPEAKPNVTWRQIQENKQSTETQRAAIAALGIVEPPFSFGPAPEPGRVWWGMLGYVDQMHICNAIMEQSGFRSGRTQALRSFSAGQGGQDDGPAVGGRGDGVGTGAAGAVPHEAVELVVGAPAAGGGA